MLTDIGNQVQYAFQFLLGHKARCPVCTLVGVDQVTLPVICPRLTVPHPHDHEDQHSQGRHTAAYTVQAVGPAEYRGDTDKEIGVGKLRRSAEGSARRLPHVIVVKELSDVAAAVEQGGQSDGDNNEQFYQLFSGDRNTLLSYALKSMHWMSTSGPQT